MRKTAERQRRKQAQSVTPLPTPSLVQVLLPMVAGMVATREDLMTWVHQRGLDALDDLFRADAEALAGPKGRHRNERDAPPLGHDAKRAAVWRPAHRRRAAAGAQHRRARGEAADGGSLPRVGPAARARGRAHPAGRVDARVRAQHRNTAGEGSETVGERTLDSTSSRSSSMSLASTTGSNRASRRSRRRRSFRRTTRVQIPATTTPVVTVPQSTFIQSPLVISPLRRACQPGC